MLFTDARVSAIEILNQLGRSWSYCGHGFGVASFGYMSSGRERPLLRARWGI